MCNRSEIEISVTSSSLLPALLNACRENADSSILQQSEKEFIARVSQSPTLKLSELRRVFIVISKVGRNQGNKALCTLLKGSKVMFPSPITSSSLSPSAYNLEERRAYLLRRQEEREYAKFIDDSSDFGKSSKSFSFHEPISQLKGQISIIVNMFVCSFAMFGVGYYVGVQYKCDLQLCIIFGLIGAVLILFIEMTLYIIRTHNVIMVNHDDEDKSLKHSSRRQTIPKHPTGVGAIREDHDLDSLYNTAISADDV